MPPNNGGEGFENEQILTTSKSGPFLEEATQTEESGTVTPFSDLEGTPIEDSSESESVMERLSRLFSTVSEF